MRAFLAVLAGFLLWSALWVGGHQGAVSAMPERYTPEGLPLAAALYGGYLAFSVVCSLAAGWLGGKLAGRARPVLVLGLLLLLVGIGFQASVWSQEPLWYHLAFLALLVPATLAGGRRAVSTA